MKRVTRFLPLCARVLVIQLTFHGVGVSHVVRSSTFPRSEVNQCTSSLNQLYAQADAVNEWFQQQVCVTFPKSTQS